ncbi:MAG: tetratricopeptide repeat protein [Planctomycetes bacterium]|nr:tetratricopeptide repeat protein [Planctomycetota bacterium]
MNSTPPPDSNLAAAVAEAHRLHAQGNYDVAESQYRKILETDPNHGEAMFYLGMLLCQTNKITEAFVFLKQAVAKYPDVYQYHYNLGLIYESIDNYPEAIACYRRTVELEPSGHTHCSLAKQLADAGQLDEAIEFAREAIKRLPPNAQAIPRNNLGIALSLKGELDEALENYRTAISMDIENAYVHSNYLLTLNYLGHPDLPMIFQEHKKFGDKFASFVPRLYVNPLAAGARAEAGSKLRVGYVSPDFYGHAVGQFIEPILAAHDREKFEIFCYSNNPRVDEATKRMQASVPNWRMIDTLPDEDAAKMIQHDRIDILVDLAGHTALNRLMIFLRKPAPVQATWIGYPNTTGLPTMDYRLTDAFADPPGEADALHTEKLLRLPECFSCFKAPAQSPDVGALPALKNGRVTFGSFNNFAKITPEVMKVWIAILKRVPGSRLVLKNRSLDNPSLKKFTMEALCKCGATPEQIELLSPNISPMEHFDCYNRIDIGLDPFPYNGTTTTCDSLWMGVPVVTLAGRNHVSRVGVSQMSNLGLPEMIAKDLDEYVDIAARLAGDLPKLAALRASLRERLRTSPLMDIPRFTRNLEQAYQTMWKNHLGAVAT